MASHIPFPVRLAAGVVATGLDRLRRLPDELPGLSVTVAGQVMRASLRVRQGMTELAGRGEELLAEWTSSPEEHPPWARFDEDDDHQTDGGETYASETDSSEPTDSKPEGQRPPRRPTDQGAPEGPTDQDAPGGPTEEHGASGPDAMPEYDDLRLTQVRARLRDLDAAAVAALLDHERSSRARASFLTLLDNRLTTLTTGDEG